MAHPQRSPHQPHPALPGFDAFETLWTGEAPAFKSEYSARWALKQQRLALIEARAVAFHLGCIVIHRERFMKVLEERAVEAYKRRYATADA